MRASKAIGAVWKSKVGVQESWQSGVGANEGEGRGIRGGFLRMSSVIITVLWRVEPLLQTD